MGHTIGAQKATHKYTKRLIRSVQAVSVVIAAGSASNTGSVNPVDVTRSFLMPGGFRGGDSSFRFNEDSVRADLTSSTVLTMQTNAANAGASRTGVMTLVEGTPWFITRVQAGSITIAAGATTGTATVNKYDMTRSVVSSLGTTGPLNSLEYATTFARVAKTDNVTLTATRGGSDASNAVMLNYQLIELNPAVVKSVQEVLIQIASGGAAASATATITPVSMADSLMFPGGFTVDTATANDIRLLPYGALTATDTVTATRPLNSATKSSWAGTVLELTPGLLKSMQRAVDAIAGAATTQNTTINQVGSLAFCTCLGFNWNVFATDGAPAFSTAELSSNTNVLCTRAASNATGVNVSREVPEFWQ